MNIGIEDNLELYVFLLINLTANCASYLLGRFISAKIEKEKVKEGKK